MSVSAPAADAERLEATVEHCIFCFDALIRNLRGLDPPKPTFGNAVCPLFVTWKQGGSGTDEGYRLRGCIGTFDAKPLHTALYDYALTSALRDSRFRPISAKEVPSLQVGVSLLTCFEQAAGGWSDWEVGTHGIIIEFDDPDTRTRRSATYLPEVAPEQGWDAQEAVESLCRKAGYHGHVSERLLRALRLTRYQSAKHLLTYDDYLKLTSYSMN